MRVVVLTKRQYTNRDVIDDRYGRLWEIPLELARDGHDVTCICLSYRERENAEEVFRDTNGTTVRWISINLGKFFVLGLLRYLFTANKIMRREKPDVVWSCSDTIYIILGYWFSRIYKCRSIADLYDNFESFASYKLPVLGFLFRKVVRECEGVSCVSESLRRHISTTYGRTKPTAVITNAVDIRVFQPMDKVACRRKLGLPEDILLVGSAGDMSSHRGADVMFRATTEQTQAFTATHVVVAGFRTTDTTIPKRECVHDLGLLPFEDVPVLLNALDLGVIYNRQSPFGEFCFPQKFYEMLACEIPIIGADVGEISLLLKNQSHLLYEDGNVNSFLIAMKRQLENPQILDFVIPSWRDQALLLARQMRDITN